MELIVGIDLGTSTSCLAAVIDGEPRVIPDSRGNRVTPSYIHVMEDGRILVGPQAKMEVISDPYSTIWATKRLIGRRYQDPEVQEAKKHFGYEILPAADGGVLVRGREKKLSPTEVAAIILKYLTRIGKKALGADITKAVVTVPAYFTDPQRKATMEAGAMIGLEIVKLVNEPTAAALAYGYEEDQEQTIAVYDLGGGTFDLSILAMGAGVFEVIATDGDSYLGGEDFDNRLVDFLVNDFREKYDINIYNDKMAHQRVKDAAERAKIALSEKEEVEINLPAICPDLNRWAGVEAVITREQYEAMVEDLVDRTINIFARLLEDASMSLEDLDNVILVGGMTRMPLVRRKVAQFIGKEPDVSMNPDEAVALGAAIHAAGLAGVKIKRKKKVPPPRPKAAELTMPGAPPDDATVPGFQPEQELTMPAVPPPEEQPLADAEPAETPREVQDSEPLPLDKDHAQLPIEQERAGELNQQPASAPAEETRAGEEWTPEQVEEEQLPLDRDRVSGLDEFFAGAETRPGTRPAQEKSEATGEKMEPREEAIPLEPEPESEAPAAGELESEPFPEEAEPWTGESDSITTQKPTPDPPPEPADDHPVSAGPIVRDHPAQPAPVEEKEEMVEPPVLLDILSQSVGIAHFGGHFVPLIKRFAKLPAKATQVFTTCMDNQKKIRITVLQGESKYAKENTPLGEFVLEGIEEARRGVPEIEVTFEIDQSGLFLVSAKDKKTGAEKSIRVENWTGGRSEEGRPLDDESAA